MRVRTYTRGSNPTLPAWRHMNARHPAVTRSPEATSAVRRCSHASTPSILDRHAGCGTAHAERRRTDPNRPFDLDEGGSATNGDVARMPLDFGDRRSCTADFDGDGTRTGMRRSRASTSAPAPSVHLQARRSRNSNRFPLEAARPAASRFSGAGNCPSWSPTVSSAAPSSSLPLPTPQPEHSLGNDGACKHRSKGAGGFSTADDG